jgi:hypothetical protein
MLTYADADGDDTADAAKKLMTDADVCCRMLMYADADVDDTADAANQLTDRC